MKIVAIGCALIILYVSTTPGDPSLPPDNKISRGHIAGYFALTLMLLWSGIDERRALLFAISYGIIMEILQLNIPGRHFDIIDVLSNALGTGVALLLNRFYKTKAK
ncbi:MAG: VanZ family protein [Candidatus Aenigmarchaeota archaeon]|nr:VanZ family protein [Candidatus Aenigmarchaeota archaeon]